MLDPGLLMPNADVDRVNPHQKGHQRANMEEYKWNGKWQWRWRWQWPKGSFRRSFFFSSFRAFESCMNSVFAGIETSNVPAVAGTF